MKRIRSRLFVALSCLSLLSFVLGCGPKQSKTPEDEAEASTPELTDVEARDRYFNRDDFTYCDATLLARHWGTGDVLTAKVRIGRELDTPGLDADLKAAREDAFNTGKLCSFFDSEYAYEDAEALALYWGITLDDAKYTVEKMLTAGNNQEIQNTLPQAYAVFYEGDMGRTGDFSDQNDEYFQAWAGSEYNYCDAWVLGNLWGADPWETKTAIGYKLVHGLESDMADIMLEARAKSVQQNELCDYHWEFSFDDALLLADHWGIEAHDAKVKIARQLTLGEHASIRGHIEEARANAPQ